MSPKESWTHTPPVVKTAEMLERKRLEAELLSLDGQVREFDRVRERLLAAEKDPSEFYRQLQARRDKLVAAIGKLAPSPSMDAGRPLPRLDQSLLTRPIAPAVFNSALGIFEFGTSGVVQAGPASEGTNVVAQGHYPHTGEIVTVPGSYPGSVTFDGQLAVGPEEIQPSQYDPTVNYFWLRNWKYVVPFPPPTGLSRLTYRFDVYAFVGLNASTPAGQLMAFVSLGETPNLTTGTDITVDIDGGWPLVVDPSQPALHYNGHYGYVDGATSVQRSFMVGAGHVPGVAIVVGVVVALPMMSDLTLFFPGLGDSYISILSENMAGRIEYTYEPQLLTEEAQL